MSHSEMSRVRSVIADDAQGWSKTFATLGARCRNVPAVWMPVQHHAGTARAKTGRASWRDAGRLIRPSSISRYRIELCRNRIGRSANLQEPALLAMQGGDFQLTLSLHPYHQNHALHRILLLGTAFKACHQRRPSRCTRKDARSQLADPSVPVRCRTLQPVLLSAT